MKTKDVLEFFGSAAETGRAIGITGQAVSQWGSDVPGTRVKAVEMAIQLENMRRDLEANKTVKYKKS